MDICVTLPKRFGLQRWIEEGDAAGDPASDHVRRGGAYFWRVGAWPKICSGERVYVVYARRLIGYSPLLDVVTIDYERDGSGPIFLVRGADAEAVTIDEEIPGFQGYRYVWWDREDEYPFPEWKEL